MTGGMPRRDLLALLLTGLGACVKGRRRYPPADHAVYDLPYTRGVEGEEKLLLDVHRPEGARDFPVVMYIHGGGWEQGDKSQMDVWCARIAQRGFVVFNINYRLAPEFPFPAAVNDCLGALAWIKLHAEDYGGDPRRVAVTGGSAGGHLCAMVATAGDHPFFSPTGFPDQKIPLGVKAYSPFFGVFDFNHPGLIALTGLRRKFLGGSPRQRPDIYRLASPVTYVRPELPPALLVCGKLDPIYDQSRLYYHALLHAGAPVEFVTYNFQGHGFESCMWTKASRDAFEKMIGFFDKNLSAASIRPPA